MQVKEFLKMQKELDDLILKNSNIKEYPNVKVKLALLVEIGELANEVQSFKYWKKNKNIKREKILEEWADCFHFALSLENFNNTLKIDNYNLNDFIEQYKTELPIYKNLKNYCTDLVFLDAFKNLNYSTTSPLMQIIVLGYRLNISSKEMEEAYLKKYKKNIQRQKENY